MVKKEFSLAEAFKYGLNTTLHHIGFYLSLGAVYMLTLVFVVVLLVVLGVIIALLVYKFIPTECELPLAFLEGKQGDPRGMVCLAGIWFILRGCAIFFSVVREWLTLGWVKIGLQEYDTATRSYRQLFSMANRLFRSSIASVLYYLMVIVGLLFFIVPGLYLSIRYYFYKFVIVDKNSSIRDAFSTSAQLTSGAFWYLLAFSMLVLFINWLGMIAFGLGWLFTFPVTVLAQTWVYRRLESYEKE